MNLFAPIYFFYIDLNLVVSTFLLVFAICCGAQEYAKKCFTCFCIEVLALGYLCTQPHMSSPLDLRLVLPALLLLVCQAHLAIEMRRV